MVEKTRILVVEDQEGFRKIYQKLLENEGYDVLMAEDGEIGWQLSKEKLPNMILLDLGLPKIDGFEVLQRIREDKDTKQIPVIIFSVMGEQQNIKKAMEMGANDYTVKGFYTPRQILSKIKSLLNTVETKKNLRVFKLQMKEGYPDAAELQREIGLTNGFHCSFCQTEMNFEAYPDYVRQDGHWFSTRIYCPQCERGF
jgi:DNA-binding response OmpR family regulator